MRAASVFLGIVALVALGLVGTKWYQQLQDARLVQWRADSVRVADATRAATLDAAKKDTVYLRARASYTAHRDHVLASGTATPRDSQTFAKCDEVERTCAERHAADSVEKASLRSEIAIARARPVERPKRLQLWSEGLYDVLSAAPVVRAGADLRILGGIHAAAAADVSIPSAAECAAQRCSVKMRALIGIRYVF